MERGSGKHSENTHFLKNPNCDICLKTKITRASCRTRTAAVLLQSGLGNEWWADSMECYCCLRTQDLLSDGKTPNERRFGMPFNGPVIPFGATVEYHPISAKDQSGLHQFGARVFGTPRPEGSMQRKC